jgi:hypothetical protein
MNIPIKTFRNMKTIDKSPLCNENNHEVIHKIRIKDNIYEKGIDRKNNNYHPNYILFENIFLVLSHPFQYAKAMIRFFLGYSLKL